MNYKYSFIIPTLNSEKYLNDCLNSLSLQTYKNIEIIIVDKSSTDKTLEIASSYTDLDIKIYTQRDNNPENAVAYGFKKSCGNFIQFLGSDDYLYDNNVLEILNNQINENDMLLCCDYCKINEQGEIIDKINTKFDYEKLLNKGNEVCATSFLINKKLFEIHDFDSLEGFDLHLMLRFGKNYNVKKLNLLYSCFRVHNQSHSGNFQKNLRNIQLDYKISMNHGGFFLNKYFIRYFIINALDKLNLLWIARLKRNFNWKLKNFL